MCTGGGFSGRRRHLTIYRHHHYTEIGFVAGVEGDKIRLICQNTMLSSALEKERGKPVRAWDGLYEAARQARSFISEEATQSQG